CGGLRPPPRSDCHARLRSLAMTFTKLISPTLPPQRLWGRLPRSLALARNDVYKVDLSHPASAMALGEIATLACARSQ
ncbi:hypothetical protein, partial [Bellilinea caldifistulae]|uniref:hypothetical protein n=1 Tax=Bellilinea caldifistulae TaxID=360411 RepID=UPI001F431C31